MTTGVLAKAATHNVAPNANGNAKSVDSAAAANDGANGKAKSPSSDEHRPSLDPKVQTGLSQAGRDVDGLFIFA
jgi:hypothetical protein